MAARPADPARLKPSTTRAAVLAELRATFLLSVLPFRLFQIAGRPYPSRIGELRDRGWDIRTGPEAMPSYRLASLTRGEADPAIWGLRASLGASSGLVISEYGSGARRLPGAL